MMIRIVLSVVIMLVFEYLSTLEFRQVYLEVNSIKLRSLITSRLQKKMAISEKLKNCFNVYNLIFVVILLFIYFSAICFKLTKLLIPSISIGLLFCTLPIIYVELQEQKYHNNLSLEVTKLISCLTRWAVVKEDVYFVFQSRLIKLMVL